MHRQNHVLDVLAGKEIGIDIQRLCFLSIAEIYEKIRAKTRAKTSFYCLTGKNYIYCEIIAA